MPNEVVDSPPVRLDGLTLAEAFRKFVIEDVEVAAMGRQLSKNRSGNSAVFLQGQFPGPFIDFHWPFHATAETIAYAFVYSPLILVDDPLPTPSELETMVSRRLSDRIGEFVGYLARGELVAVGTFVATGAEGPVGRGQWMRKNLSVDLGNSDICEYQNPRHFAVWTGVFLQLPDQNSIEVARSAGNESTKARKQIQTKENCRLACFDWLISVMSDPKITPRTRDELWADAASTWPEKLSKREFDRCRSDVLSRLNEEQRYLWGRPGPKPKRS